MLVINGSPGDADGVQSPWSTPPPLSPYVVEDSAKRNGPSLIGRSNICGVDSVLYTFSLH